MARLWLKSRVFLNWSLQTHMLHVCHVLKTLPRWFAENLMLGVAAWADIVTRRRCNLPHAAFCKSARLAVPFFHLAQSLVQKEQNIQSKQAVRSLLFLWKLNQLCKEQMQEPFWVCSDLYQSLRPSKSCEQLGSWSKPALSQYPHDPLCCSTRVQG